jgi:hypothetical protein
MLATLPRNANKSSLLPISFEQSLEVLGSREADTTTGSTRILLDLMIDLRVRRNPTTPIYASIRGTLTPKNGTGSKKDTITVNKSVSHTLFNHRMKQASDWVIKY